MKYPLLTWKLKKENCFNSLLGQFCISKFSKEYVYKAGHDVHILNPALVRLRQEDLEFKANLGCIEGPDSKKRRICEQLMPSESMYVQFNSYVNSAFHNWK
jgi:hypothetical protein